MSIPAILQDADRALSEALSDAPTQRLAAMKRFMSSFYDIAKEIHAGNGSDQIRAQSIGRGVAVLKATPHANSIRWIGGTPDGAVVSLSIDGTITRTSFDNKSTVLARNVSPRGRFAYSHARSLLAYACDPDDLCMWDVQRGMQVHLPHDFRNPSLQGIAFSPDGAKLALLSSEGSIQVFDISLPDHPTRQLEVHREHAVGILFLDDETLAVGIAVALSLEALHLSGKTEAITIHDNFLWATDPRNRRFALATQHGEGLSLQTSSLRVVDRIRLCHDTPTGLSFIPQQDVIAFSCREGTIGLWNLLEHTITAITHLDGHVDTIMVDHTGDYLLAGGGNGTPLSSLISKRNWSHGIAVMGFL